MAGVPFYLHAHTAVIAPHDVTGNVLMTIDQTPEVCRCGMCRVRPRRCVAASASSTGAVDHADPLPRCQPGKRQLRRELTGSTGSGFALDIEFPVVVDSPTSGTAAMTAMWATTDVGLSNNNVLATVPGDGRGESQPADEPDREPDQPHEPDGHQETTVEAAEGEEGSPTTPKVCKVHKSTVVFKKKGANSSARSTGTP